jgi:hypothetical protein
MWSDGETRDEDELNVVHGLDGGVGFTILGEAHESKAATAASIAILDHDLRTQALSGTSWADGRTATHGLFDLAKLLKLGSEGNIIRVPREAANISSVALARRRRWTSTNPIKTLDMTKSDEKDRQMR